MYTINYSDIIDHQLFNKELLNIIKLYDTNVKTYNENLKISDCDTKSIIYFDIHLYIIKNNNIYI